MNPNDKPDASTPLSATICSEGRDMARVCRDMADENDPNDWALQAAEYIENLRKVQRDAMQRAARIHAEQASEIALLREMLSVLWRATKDDHDLLGDPEFWAIEVRVDEYFSQNM